MASALDQAGLHRGGVATRVAVELHLAAGRADMPTAPLWPVVANHCLPAACWATRPHLGDASKCVIPWDRVRERSSSPGSRILAVGRCRMWATYVGQGVCERVLFWELGRFACLAWSCQDSLKVGCLCMPSVSSPANSREVTSAALSESNCEVDCG